jgi:precorrin-6A/cobalt-precorrin-6A reductase
LPPTTSSASATSRCATGERPATPSSPMPTMDSQRAGGQLSGMRVLVLGGTIEASALAHLLAGDKGFDAILSFAGRTTRPRPQPIATRVGGFGGADGLAAYLREQAIEAVIDATHPYADRISANAVAACKQTGVPLATVVRAPWQPQPGDKWQRVASTEEAAMALGRVPKRVFLSVGRQDLGAFARAPQHDYLARTVDAPEGVLPPTLEVIQARGPFDKAAERRLLEDGRIEIVVSKNSGGEATYAKIDAARELGLRVVMIERPAKAAGHAVESPEAAMLWLVQERTSRRGV